MEKHSSSAHESKKSLISPVQEHTAYSCLSHVDTKQPMMISPLNGDLHASLLEKEKLVDDQLQEAAWFSWREVKSQCSLAGPLMLGTILYFLLQLVSTSFVGHTGSLELSGASLANSFAVVTGNSVLVGMSGALETLCGQSFGAGDYKMVGVYMQRMMLVLNMVAVPIAVLWIFIEPILGALGQDAELASKAGAYGRWLVPTLFAAAFYMPLIKFLQAQSIVFPMFVCFTITLIFHVPICWVLVFHSSLGYLGAALANSISMWISVLCFSLYVKFSPKCAACRTPFSSAALHDLKGLLQLAIPSALMTCLEWWSYEVLVIISGFLPNPQLQTGIIALCVNSETLLFMIPAALCAAVSTRVSNELGAGNPWAARQAANVAYVLSSLEALIVVVVLLLVRNVWGLIYSSDEEVVTALAAFVPFFAISSGFDALQAVLSGIVRGAGWQKAGAYMNLASFYIAGLPTACLLAFVAHLEGKGLWMGLIVGIIVQFVSYIGLIYCLDWELEAKRAAERLGVSSSASQFLPPNV